MKFTHEVVAALNVLRHAAENDFERHRINILERDLTTPPQVEVIDDNHQRLNGIVFHKDTNGHFTNSFSIHRAVWIYHNGEIPSGYHIHHVDNNKANNAIDNLQCLTKEEHRAIHNNQLPLNNLVCEVCGKEFVSYSVNARFCSKKCMRKSNYKKNFKEHICAYCGKTFRSEKTSRKFCSKSCSAKSQSEGYRIKKICPVCGKEFETYKNYETKTCSYSCAHKLRSLSAELIEKICPVCGKKFTTRNSRREYCSPTCVVKNHRQKEKSQKLLDDK